MPSRIPEARVQIATLAKKLERGSISNLHAANQLRDILPMLRRDVPEKRAQNRDTPMSAELAERIREYAKYRPALSQREIAQEFNVNPGRVSEALKGQR